MGDSEKLMSLKKAYADIILNTAKESATRIMVSETKSIRFQQELFAAKEEGLHMLLRLKQMMDAKISEAEMTSLSQQKKIEELEAQLQEAEDIVRDLREELREVQDELEKVTTNKVQPLGERNLEGYTASLEETSQGNRLNTCGSIIFTPESHPKSLTTPDMKNLILNDRIEGNKCYNTNDSYTENHYIGNPDFASIIMRTKEPEQYRNGCTQRIRAFERNLLDGKLSFSRQVNDGYKESVIREVEGEGIRTVPTPKADDPCSLKKQPDDFKEVTQEDGICYPVQSIHRKRKRAPRYRRSKPPLCWYLSHQVMDMCQASDLSFSKNYACPVSNTVYSGESHCNVTENEVQKDPEPLPASNFSSDTTETNMQSEHIEVTENNSELVKACSVLNTINNDKALLDTLVLTRQESGSAESSGLLASKMDLETVNVSLVDSDLKASDATTERVASRPANDRLIKYTFQRKRKKEPLSSTNRSASLENSTLKRKMEGKQIGPSEPQKSSSITESSRDSWRIAQVAHQLVTLSEKKW